VSRSFEDRFTGKLAKIDHGEIEAFLQRLIRQKDFLETVLESLREGVVVTSPTLKVLVMNAAARHLLRVPNARRVQGRPLLDVLQQPELRRIFLSFDPDRGRRAETVSVRRLEGGQEVVQHLEVQMLPLGGSGADGAGLLLTMRDTSEEHQIEQQQRALERLATLATLTAGVAHEIKNPLNSLGIHAQLLDKRAKQAIDRGQTLEPEPVRESVQIILEETQRLSAVVQDFLDAVRPTRPTLEMHDLNEVCQHVRELLEPQARLLGIKLEARPDFELGRAQFDRRQLTQAVLNLAKNAIEAITERREKMPDIEPPDEIDRILLRTRGTPETVALAVEDTGIGVSEENLPRIFEPYFTTKFHGTGLGLMNVTRIVQEHDGRLDLSSELGVGSVFTITLPRKAPVPVRALPWPVESPETRPPKDAESDE